MSHVCVDFDLQSEVLRAVDDVSLEIRQGDIFALVGESGCGKSTLAAALINLVPEPGRIVSGEIEVRGKRVSAMSAEEQRRSRAVDVATVFQAAMSSFNPVVTIGQQVRHVLDAHPEVWPNRDDGVRYFHHLLELVGLPPERVSKGFESQLSGGMKQRASIAFSLLLKPPIVVLDEPTTALDVINQRVVIDILQDLHDELGVTILFVTHDLAVVAELATTVGVMYAGRMVQVASIDEVFFSDRRHPYVEALLNSIPSVFDDTPVHPIPGMVPRLDQLPGGCRFAPRCHRAVPSCTDAEPPLVPGSDDNAVACFVVNGLSEQGLSEQGVRQP